MKKALLLSLLLIATFPASAFAQAKVIRNSSLATIAGEDLGPSALVTSATGELFCTAGTSATSLGKAEDAAHVSGDTLIGIAAVRNDSNATTFTSANGDYSPIAVDSQGDVFIAVATGATGLGKAEDNVAGNGDTGVESLFITQDPLSVDQSASGDYATPKIDRTGRVMVGPAPHSEFWSSCGTATAVTSDVAIKASVASNRIYVSSITCKNTSSTTGSNLDFKDGSTIIAVGSIGEFTIAAANNGVNTYPINFPTPLRLSSATAFNFATNTAVTSVTCCGAGFISVD